ncbi:hypothetical protein NMG60_11030343 [Bertholletia excelsa]
MAVVAVARTAATLTEGATPTPPTPSCGAKLIPCVGYINSTNPPAACCHPLREMVNKEMPSSSRAAATSPAASISAYTVTIRSHETPIASVPSSPPPPATPGNDNNEVGRIAWTGIPGIILFWASLKFL